MGLGLGPLGAHEDPKRAGKDQGQQLPTSSAPSSPHRRLPHSYAVHKWEPLGLFLTAAFTQPTIVPGPSGMPTLLHTPTTALPCLLPHLAPSPDIQHKSGAHPEYTYMHHRNIHLPGEAPDSELPLVLSPDLPSRLVHLLSSPLDTMGGFHPRSTLVAICRFILKVRKWKFRRSNGRFRISQPSKGDGDLGSKQHLLPGVSWPSPLAVSRFLPGPWLPGSDPVTH